MIMYLMNVVILISCSQYNYSQLAEMIESVLQYQGSPYDFEPRLDVSDPCAAQVCSCSMMVLSPSQIIAYVTAAKRLSENELYDLSVKREPR